MGTVYYYILRDDKIIGRAGTRENALDFVRAQQENETDRYYFGQALRPCKGWKIVEKRFVKMTDDGHCIDESFSA